MQDSSSNHFKDLLVRRDFGEILVLYFEFLKRNFKAYVQVFIRFNGLFMIGLLLTSYLLVSGFSGLINTVGNQTIGVAPDNGVEYGTYMIFGLLLYLVILLLAGAMNFAISTSYLVHYQNSEGEKAGPSETWKLFRDRIGETLLFIVLAAILIIISFIIGVFLSFIPLIGPLLYYAIFFFLSAWLGVSYFAMIGGGKGLGDALGEGWDLVTQSLWTCIGANFILGILNYVLMLLLMTIPGVLIGIYAFHQFETEGQQTIEWLDTIVFTLGLGILLIMGILNQSLAQWVNGMLYYALHEKKYNTNIRKKIELIGKPDPS